MRLSEGLGGHARPAQGGRRVGFGSTILNVLAARALQGSCDLRFEPGGVVWTLRAPLPALREAA